MNNIIKLLLSIILIGIFIALFTIGLNINYATKLYYIETNYKYEDKIPYRFILFDVREDTSWLNNKYNDFYNSFITKCEDTPKNEEKCENEYIDKLNNNVFITKWKISIIISSIFIFINLLIYYLKINKKPIIKKYNKYIFLIITTLLLVLLSISIQKKLLNHIIFIYGSKQVRPTLYRTYFLGNRFKQFLSRRNINNWDETDDNVYKNIYNQKKTFYYSSVAPYILLLLLILLPKKR